MTAVFVISLLAIAVSAATAWMLARQRVRPPLANYEEVEALWAARQGDQRTADVLNGLHHPPINFRAEQDHGA